jgi:maltoporin
MGLSGCATWIACTFFCLPACLAAQTPAQNEMKQIRQEMEQMRQEYGLRMKELDARLTRLEASSAGEATQPAPAAPHAAEAGPKPAPGAAAPAPQPESRREFADELFRNATESRNQTPSGEPNQALRERAEKVLQDFVEIAGYFRAGYGRDGEGGPQVASIAPGALAKGRLGNEAENYGELIFSKNFYLPGKFSLQPSRGDGTPSGPIARFQARLSMYDPYQAYADATATSLGLAEAWASIGNLSARQPEMKFWAGNRFYQRYDIHINDFFIYNMSGGGGGVEDIGNRLGKIDVAWIGQGSQSGFSDTPQPNPANQAGFSKTNLVLDLHDTRLPGGKGFFGLTWTRATSGLDANGNTAPNTTGAAFTFIHM